MCQKGQFMLRSRLKSLLTCFLLGVGAQAVTAHQVPNMTVEADFEENGSFEMRVNLDPRTFLSRTPSMLAPLDAAWYLEQSAEQKALSLQMAADMLRGQLLVKFDGQSLPLPEIEWQPLDGATNTPLREDTEEVHLLATVRGMVPTGAGDFSLSYAPSAQVSLILLVRTPVSTEPRVQVIFPGESSRPEKIPTAPKVIQAASNPSKLAETRQGQGGQESASNQPTRGWWLLLPCVVGPLLLLALRVTRR